MRDARDLPAVRRAVAPGLAHPAEGGRRGGPEAPGHALPRHQPPEGVPVVDHRQVDLERHRQRQEGGGDRTRWWRCGGTSRPEPGTCLDSSALRGRPDPGAPPVRCVSAPVRCTRRQAARRLACGPDRGGGGAGGGGGRAGPRRRRRGPPRARRARRARPSSDRRRRARRCRCPARSAPRGTRRATAARAGGATPRRCPAAWGPAPGAGRSARRPCAAPAAGPAPGTTGR